MLALFLLGYGPGGQAAAPQARWEFTQRSWQNETGLRYKKHLLLNSAGVSASRFTWQEGAQAPKSKGRAFLQSLVLPGWGQHYADSKTMMKVFIVSEVALWATYLGFTTWGNWLQDDYRTFAATHAGANISGKPRRYFVDIGNFDSIVDYNQAQLRGRDVRALYPVTEEFFWQWDDRENRRRYEDLRVRSDAAKNRAQLTLAVIFVNHLVSAIHATLAVHKFNEKLEKAGLGLQFKLGEDPTQLNPSLSLRFSF